MKTSLWIRAWPGSTLPSSATSVMPGTGAVAGPVVGPTIDGTCMRRPALTRRTSTLPATVGVHVVAGDTGVQVALDSGLTGYRDAATLVVSNARPLIR